MMLSRPGARLLLSRQLVSHAWEQRHVLSLKYHVVASDSSCHGCCMVLSDSLVVLHAVCSKKYQIEQMDGEKVLSRQRGFTVDSCVSAIAADSETPEFNGLSTGEKVRHSSQSCWMLGGVSRPARAAVPGTLSC